MKKRSNPIQPVKPVSTETPEYKPKNVGEYEVKRLKKAKRA